LGDIQAPPVLTQAFHVLRMLRARQRKDRFVRPADNAVEQLKQVNLGYHFVLSHG
jgi:hypothetical protein